MNKLTSLAVAFVSVALFGCGGDKKNTNDHNTITSVDCQPNEYRNVVDGVCVAFKANEYFTSKQTIAPCPEGLLANKDFTGCVCPKKDNLAQVLKLDNSCAATCDDVNATATTEGVCACNTDSILDKNTKMCFTLASLNLETDGSCKGLLDTKTNKCTSFDEKKNFIATCPDFQTINNAGVCACPGNDQKLQAGACVCNNAAEFAMKDGRCLAAPEATKVLRNGEWTACPAPLVANANGRDCDCPATTHFSLASANSNEDQRKAACHAKIAGKAALTGAKIQATIGAQSLTNEAFCGLVDADSVAFLFTEAAGATVSANLATFVRNDYTITAQSATTITLTKTTDANKTYIFSTEFCASA